MLTALRLLNFQRHADLEVLFDQAITTIVGPTDAGKSAVLRALRWACLNQPRGDGFIRQGTDQASVEIEVDGRTVTRRRSGSDNVYALDTHESEFRSFGSGGVPQPISEILNLSEVNFQDQLDPPFWLALSPPEVSRQLNAIVDLGVIDATMANIAKATRELQQTVKGAGERLSRAKADTERLDWIVAADQEYQAVESLNRSLAQVTTRRQRLGTAVRTIGDLKQDEQRHALLFDAITIAGKAGAAANAAGAKVKGLREKIKSIKELQAVAGRTVPDIGQLEAVREKLLAIRNRISLLAGTIGHVQQRERELHVATVRHDDAESKFQELVGTECPTCGQVIEGLVHHA